MFSKLIAIAVLLSIAVAVPAGATTIMIDDFNNPTLNTEWDSSTVLNAGPATGTWDFDTTTHAGQLTATLSGFTGVALQEVLLRDDVGLGVGETLVTDLVDVANWTNALGSSKETWGALAIAMSTGITSRTDYLYVGYREKSNGGVNNRLYWYYFDHTGQYLTTTGSIDVPHESIDELFIARTSANTFDVGYSSVGSETRDVLATLTTDPLNIPGNAIGYFTDIRNDGNVMYDNFRKEVIPEPSTLALLATGLLGLLAYAWRKRK